MQNYNGTCLSVTLYYRCVIIAKTVLILTISEAVAQGMVFTTMTTTIMKFQKKNMILC